MVLENILASLGSFFLFPEGLIALTGLIPLLIFYLIKKEPERKVMPSYMFFRREQRSGSASQALQTLLRNLILLLHILLVVGFSVAIAEPYITGKGSPDHSVLILDQSASMEGDFREAKNFLKDNLGKKNTLIKVSDESRVAAEGVSGRRASSLIKKAELKHTSTDIHSALESAKLRGTAVFVGSDLDQTRDGADPLKVFESFRSSGKQFKVMETGRRNSWGIVNMDVGGNTTVIEVQNFENRSHTVDVTANGNSRKEKLEPKSVSSIRIDSKEGKNTVKLEKDDFTVDNRARFYVPGEEEFKVVIISDPGNRYLKKVFELVKFTSVEEVRPPVQNLPEADLYVVGRTNRLITDTVDEIGSRVKNGDSLVLFGNQEFTRMGFDQLPVKPEKGYSNVTVSIKKPVRINLGEMKVKNVKRTRGKSFSSKPGILVRSDYGSGEFLFYNLEDEKFRTRFLYPVFWKEISGEMLERKEIDELNLRTGQEINYSIVETPSGEKLSGRVELEREGFYRTQDAEIAANMLDSDESLREGIEVSSFSRNPGQKSQRKLQGMASLLLLILIAGELLYLYWIGDLQ
ncbi:MAG: BatA domain-containing protein [Candidatus Nanohaloarchaea archaeon]